MFSILSRRCLVCCARPPDCFLLPPSASCLLACEFQFFGAPLDLCWALKVLVFRCCQGDRIFSSSIRSVSRLVRLTNPPAEPKPLLLASVTSSVAPSASALKVPQKFVVYFIFTAFKLEGHELSAFGVKFKLHCFRYRGNSDRNGFEFSPLILHPLGPFDTLRPVNERTISLPETFIGEVFVLISVPVAEIVVAVTVKADPMC
jgi:hypothetical protein